MAEIPAPLSSPDPLPPLLVSDQTVAHLLGCSRRMVWRLTHAGRLPEPIKLAGITRWPYQGVVDAVARLTGKGGAA